MRRVLVLALVFAAVPVAATGTASGTTEVAQLKHRLGRRAVRDGSTRTPRFIGRAR